MTIVYAASEQEAMVRPNTNVGEVATAAAYDATYARTANRVGANGTNSDYNETPLFSSLTTAYIHWERFQVSNYPSSTTMLECQNSSGTPVFRLQNTGTSTTQAQYWNGSSWTSIGSTFALTANTRYALDLKIICGSSGSFELYSNGTVLLASGSASMSSVTNIAKVKTYNQNPGTQAANVPYWSQLVVADVPTYTWKLESKPPTSNGADTATGTYAEIDELALVDADIVSLAASGNRASFKAAARTLPTNYTVKGVTATARAKCGASGPTQMYFYLTIGGTRYYSPAITLTITLAPYQYTWETDPSTGLDWTEAAAEDANLEWGYEAV